MTRATILVLLVLLSTGLASGFDKNDYASARAGFTAGDGVQVDDTAVYKTGYVSENGSEWTAFPLAGDTQVRDWILSSASADINLTGIRYVAAYSCTWSSGWSCSETWQVKDRGVQNTIDSKAGDEAALQALYASAGGTSWNDQTGWGENMDLSQPIDRVTVQTINAEPRVTEIDLRDNGLTGSIDVPELANLKQLRLFNVMFNALDSEYPAALHQATNLEYLYLSGSDETAPINKDGVHPHEHGTQVHIGKTKSNEYNKFHGAIPESISNLQNLKWFALSWTDDWSDSRSVGDSPTVINGITSIPDTLWDIPSLVGIQIYENWNIAGSGNTFSLPDSIADMQNLQTVHLGGGSGTSWDEDEQGFMTGTYPADMDQLTELKYVSFSNNGQLSGIPDVRASTDLRQLTLAFTNSADGGGSMPAWLVDGTFSNLDSISLAWPQGTEFTGEIPAFGSMSGLDLASFDGHAFSGSLPESFWHANPGGIKKASFRENQLTSIGTTDLTSLEGTVALVWPRNEVSEPWPNLDWADPPIVSSAYLDGNHYVFKHMLYVPDNAPNGETIFELYQEVAQRFEYSPQQPFGQAATRSVSTGGSITLDDFNTVVEHTDNEYQWRKDGSSISGATNRELTISDLHASDAGEYRLRVTNPNIPDLTLTSEPVTLSVTDASTDSKTGDEDALQALYVAANGEGWDNNQGWSASGMDLSDEIYGVTVEQVDGQPRVTQIDLRANGLTGSIDVPELGNLKELRLFAVTFNDLDTQIPPEIGQATNLEYLYLSMSDATVYTEEWPHERATWGSGDIHPGKRKGAEGNIYRGAVPPEIGNLQKLKWFMLDWTDSEEGAEDGISSVPQELFDISTMQGLHLFNNNNIADLQLPASVCEMTNLDQIAIGVEKSGRDTGPLVGQMPTCFGQLENVRHVRFGENPDFTTDFDAVDFSNMRSIMTFSVSATRVTGSLPKYFVDGTMPELIMFGSSWPRGDTGLEGAFPEVNPVMDMHIYQFRNNKLTSLPASAWTGNTKIIQPEFADNRLTTLGTTDMTMQDRFRYFRASGNELHEPWPYLDWDTIAAQGGLDGAEFDDNRYVFKHMLYVPPNGDKPIIEHYQDMIDADSGNAGLDYRSQKPFGQAASYTISAGDDITIDDFADIVEHPNNEYWWEHDGNTISGENSDTLTINNADSGDNGEYVLYADNDGAPGLTIQSQPVQITVN